MKTLWILLLSLMVWKDHALAVPFSFQPSFCERISEKFVELHSMNAGTDVLDSCFNYSIEYSNASLQELCLNTHERFLGDPKGATAYCEVEYPKMSSIQTTGEATVINAVFGTLPAADKFALDAATTSSSSKELNECQTKTFLDKYNECNIVNAPISMSLESFSDILNYPTQSGKVMAHLTPVYSESDCKCLDQKVKSEYKLKSKGQLNQDLQTERDRINGLIYNAAGKKFLNNYAANYEDVRFYMTNKFKALGSTQEMANSLLCNDTKAFEAGINEVCAANGVSKATSDKRTKELLSSLGDDMSSPTLEGKFKVIDDYILNFKASKEEMDAGPSQTITRTEYDMFRNGAYKKAPEVNFMNSLLEGVMKNPALKKAFDENLKNKNPGHALSLVMQDENSQEVKNLLDNLIKKNPRVPLYQKLKGALKSPSADDYSEILRQTYKVAVGTHPGLKAILSDKTLFQNVQEKVQYSSGSESYLETMEATPAFLNDHFSRSCTKMRKNLAEAVCTPNEDHIKRVKKDDINKLLVQIDGRIKLPLKDLLLCQMPDIEPKGVFNKLSFGFGDWLNRSDYLNRKLNPINKQDNGYSGFYRAMNGSNSKNRNLVSALVAGLASESRDSSPEISKEISKGTTISSTTMNRINSKMSESSSPSQVAAGPSENTVAENNYAPAPLIMPASLANTATTPLESQSGRGQLKDYLSDKTNEKEVEKHLANASNEDVKELLRLKDEIARDKEKMQNLLAENDKNKVSSLEEKYQKLHKEYQDALKQKAILPSEVASSNSDNENRNESDTYRGSTSGSYVSSGSDSGQTGGSRFSGNSTGATTGGQSRSIASSSRGSLSDSSTVNTAARESTRGEIIIESSRIHSPDTPTGSQEINQEIISFVNQHETDTATLQKLKEKGMILKFKVMQDGREVEKEMKVDYASMSPEAKQILDKKIAHQGLRKDQFSNVENEYLKARRAYSYSALKMILGIQAQKK